MSICSNGQNHFLNGSRTADLGRGLRTTEVSTIAASPVQYDFKFHLQIVIVYRYTAGLDGGSYYSP